jgi:hypothetical protein
MVRGQLYESSTTTAPYGVSSGMVVDSTGWFIPQCDCFSVQLASNMPLDENMGIVDEFSVVLFNELRETRKEQALCCVAYLV